MATYLLFIDGQPFRWALLWELKWILLYFGHFHIFTHAFDLIALQWIFRVQSISGLFYTVVVRQIYWWRNNHRFYYSPKCRIKHRVRFNDPMLEIIRRNRFICWKTYAFALFTLRPAHTHTPSHYLKLQMASKSHNLPAKWQYPRRRQVQIVCSFVRSAIGKQ